MHNSNGIWDTLSLMPVATLVFGAVLITAAVLTIRYLTSSSGDVSAAVNGWSCAERLLAERYSRGEIDIDEYQQKLTLLHQHR
ncbi:hypothetical protein A5725_17575 [Mycobacterium kubicae]|nr:hypothetical protein A5725_17575 [Mycobacterium kubicae]OBK49075.1 hypothetical protein A5657_01645 [Mycobacterium kubicae]